MKIVSIEFSQVTKLVSYNRPIGQLYLPEALVKIQERYGFVRFPQPNEIVPQDGTQPLVFLHGKFGETSINAFKVYKDGVLADSQAPVEIIEAFVNDALDWACEEFGVVELDVTPITWAYDSHIVVQCGVEFEGALEKLNSVGDEISQLLQSYGTAVKPYRPSGVSLYADTMQEVMAIRPSAFKIERREVQPYERGLYFSTAPLKTNDHLAVLEKLERLFS